MLIQWGILLILLLLQCLWEVEETRVVFRIADSVLSVVWRWNATSVLAQLMRYRDFVCIRLIVVMHFLCEELNLLLLEVAGAYQLCPVHSFLFSNVRVTCSVWTSYCRCSTWRWNSIPLVASFEKHRPRLRLSVFLLHVLLMLLGTNHIRSSQVWWNLTVCG